MLVDRIWKDQPGKYGCISTKSASGKWEDHFFPRSKFKDIVKFFAENSDKDLYFCPHLFSDQYRQKKYAVLPKLLWSDLDEADPRDMKIKPTFAIQSSPGRYVGIWRMTETVTESLNRRLAYALGADVSGWDLTQVLRVPGTVNYKYDSLPKTKVLWSDGDEWTVDQIEAMVPPEEELDSMEETDAAEVLKKHEKAIPHWCLRELRSQRKPPEGKRSEMLWKLGNTLSEAGLKSDEVFVLLKASVWNKFAGRRNEDQQLRREVDKTINRKHQAKQQVAGEGEDEDEDDYQFLSTSLAEVEPENVDWIWYPYLARKTVTIIEGDPEAGKSYILQNISGRLCAGQKLPCDVDDMPLLPPQRIAYFDIENDVSRVTKKRMDWNGFGPGAQANFFQEERPFSIDDDATMAKVADGLSRVRPDVIVFDTMNTYIGGANTSQGAQGQQAFIKFVELAKRYNAAVVVLRHLTKGGRDRAMYRGQGNIAFTGVARIVMLCGKHPDDPDIRVMACSKESLTAKPPALCYEIKGAGTKKERDKSQIEFGEFCDLSADDLVAVADKKDSKERDEARTFLEETLARGPVEFDKIMRMAGPRSISESTLRRAAKELGVETTSEGFGKKKVTMWAMPD
jgi:DNA repair protein RadA/Sms